MKPQLTMKERIAIIETKLKMQDKLLYAILIILAAQFGVEII